MTFSPVVLAFVSVTAVSAVSLAGLLTLSMSERRLKQLAAFFISFAAGALLGDAFIHLIPGIFATTREPLVRSLLILGGILLFFAVEKLIRREQGTIERPALAVVNVIGDGIHNFIDGLLIGASWLAGPALGVSTSLAVLLHEIPQELGDFSVLIHSGLTVRTATLVNAGSAAVAILGTAAAILLGAVAHQTVVELLVPVTAGGFVYIAAADLIPELQLDRSAPALITQTALIAAGIAVMAML
jgi:zinc and cadmium transporter